MRRIFCILFITFALCPKIISNNIAWGKELSICVIPHGEKASFVWLLKNVQITDSAMHEYHETFLKNFKLHFSRDASEASHCHCNAVFCPGPNHSVGFNAITIYRPDWHSFHDLDFSEYFCNYSWSATSVNNLTENLHNSVFGKIASHRELVYNQVGAFSYGKSLLRNAAAFLAASAASVVALRVLKIIMTWKMPTPANSPVKITSKH